MSVNLVLTVIGKDRPGIVELLSQIVAAHEGNWLESRMAHLAGEFAHAASAKKEVILAALEYERWLADSCRELVGPPA